MCTNFTYDIHSWLFRVSSLKLSLSLPYRYGSGKLKLNRSWYRVWLQLKAFFMMIFYIQHCSVPRTQNTQERFAYIETNWLLTLDKSLKTWPLIFTVSWSSVSSFINDFAAKTWFVHNSFAYLWLGMCAPGTTEAHAVLEVDSEVDEGICIDFTIIWQLTNCNLALNKYNYYVYWVFHAD